VSAKLALFKEKKEDLYNFRCCYCGDSSKNKTKSRGFVYRKGNDYFFRCHNCGEGHTFYNFLQYLDPFLSKEYALERFRNGEDGNHNYQKPKMDFGPLPFRIKTKTFDIPSIKELPDSHPAKQYIIERKIPKIFHKELFYAESFSDFVKKEVPNYEKPLNDNDPRIIIPFRDFEENIKMFQGRALSQSPIRYISVKKDDEFRKIFGLDRLNLKERIYILEAPLDSLFVKNSVATADSSLDVGLSILENVNVEKVLVPDIQPRNKQIVSNIGKWIEKGYNVCLLPPNLNGKDVNELIMKGMSKPKLEMLLKECTFNGLRAKVEFQKWKGL
jgi:DNA-binding protein Fis